MRLKRFFSYLALLPFLLGSIACGDAGVSGSSSLSSPPLLQESTDDNPGYLSVYLVLACLREVGSYKIPGDLSDGGRNPPPDSSGGREDRFSTCDYICEVKAEAESNAELKYFLDELNTILDLITAGLDRCNEFQNSGNSSLEGCAGFEHGQGNIVPIVDDFLQLASCN